MNARELTWNLLTEVNERGALSHEAFAEAMERYAPSGADRALVTRLFNGALERQETIDRVIERQTGRPVGKVKTKIRNLLRMSVYQMLFLQRVPAAAACNEAVSLAKKHGLAGLAGFVNGTLRGLDREISASGGQEGYLKVAAAAMGETERLCFLYSMPEWIVTRLREDFPKADIETILRAFLAESGVTVRLNRSRGDMETLRRALAEEGIKPGESVLDNCLRLRGAGNPAELAAYRDGLFSIQDVSAVLAGNLLPLVPGMRVLDLCAAPGGKTVHAADELAALAKEAGRPAEGAFEVESRDVGEGKLPLIREQLDRVKLPNVHCAAADASVYDPKLEAWADIVIADVPCSGLGVIGRKPDIRYKTKSEDIEALAGIQREIVRQAVRYVKPGGLLAYSTCTTARAENEDIASFIVSLGMTPVKLAEKLPADMREACERQGGLEGIGLQIFPEPERWDGFYIAEFRRPE